MEHSTALPEQSPLCLHGQGAISAGWSCKTHLGLCDQPCTALCSGPGQARGETLLSTCHSTGACLCPLLPYSTHTHCSELLCVYYRLDGAAQLVAYVGSHAELQDLHSLGYQVHGRLHFVPLLAGGEVEASPHPVEELQDPDAEGEQQELVLPQLGCRGQLAAGADLQSRGRVSQSQRLPAGKPAPGTGACWGKELPCTLPTWISSSPCARGPLGI